MHIFDNLKQYDTRYKIQSKSETNISDDVKAFNQRVENEERKEYLLSAFLVPIFFIFLIGGIIVLANSDFLQYVVACGAALIAILFVLFTTYVLMTNARHKKWKRIFIAAIIAIIIIALLLMIGYVAPDGFVNDGHRPDRF